MNLNWEAVLAITTATAAIGTLLALVTRLTIGAYIAEFRLELAKLYVPREVYQTELDETKRRITQLEYKKI
jgi:hypothetical protein